MPLDTARELFDDMDTNRDGKIDRKELSEWVNDNVIDEGVTTTTRRIDGDYTVVRTGGTDYTTDVNYGASTADTLFDRIDTNRNNVIERSEFNRFVNDDVVGTTDATYSTTYTSRYPTDSRGFYLDPNPEIITRPNPEPGPTYIQNIKIRYLQPPPLPPSGQVTIREVRPPPLPPGPPHVIREPGKPGYQPPPLVLRERPPEPPPALPPVVKTVTLPPLPPPPRSTIIEKYPNLPNRPRDIILERWLPYGPRPHAHTVRVPAGNAVLPPPPHNRIIQYLGLEARVVRQFQKLGVVQADPQTYLREYGSTLLDPVTFEQQARAAGVVEDITVPAGATVRFSTTGHDHYHDGYGHGLHRTYIGGSSDNIIGSSEYTRGVGSDNLYTTYGSSDRVGGSTGYTSGLYDTGSTVVVDTPGIVTRIARSADEVGGFIQQRL